MSPHGHWVFLLPVFILSVGFIFKLSVGWLNKSPVSHTEPIRVCGFCLGERKLSQTYLQHTSPQEPELGHMPVIDSITDKKDGSTIIGLKNYLGLNEYWDIYHSSYYRVLIPEIRSRRLQRGFGLACLGSYVQPLDQSLQSPNRALQLPSLDEVAIP